MRRLLPCLVLLSAACHSVPLTESPAPVVSAQDAVASIANAGAIVDATLPPWKASAADAEVLRAALSVRDQLRLVHLVNLANACTPGFKRRVALLSTRLCGGDDAAQPVPVMLRSQPQFTSGVIEQTGRALDLAIEGHGMFAVRLPDGQSGYTRDGRLHVDRDGKVVTCQGGILLPDISVPSDLLELSIDAKGQVSCRTAGSPDVMTQLGQLTLNRFVAAEQLQEVHDNIWLETDASGPPITETPGIYGLGTLRQGCLERANVDVEAELAALRAVEQDHQRLLGLARQLGVVTK